jgi:hypothetical protein
MVGMYQPGRGAFASGSCTGGRTSTVVKPISAAVSRLRAESSNITVLCGVIEKCLGEPLKALSVRLGRKVCGLDVVEIVKQAVQPQRSMTFSACLREPLV